MYGLPKIHKEREPGRPIISVGGTYNFRLPKYLDQILKPLIPTNNYIIKDTFDFVNMPNTPNQRMVSFDVESLFTNIPTQETINIILDRASKDNATEYYGLKRITLEMFLIICTQNFTSSLMVNTTIKQTASQWAHYSAHFSPISSWTNSNSQK